MSEVGTCICIVYIRIFGCSNHCCGRGWFWLCTLSLVKAPKRCCQWGEEGCRWVS